MTRRRLTLRAADGHALHAYCHEPEGAPRASIVIAPGMAIPQTFYADFAVFLARQGYRTWTFDYRGMGEARYDSMRACRADISAWVTNDYDTMVRHAAEAAPGLPLFVLGHSLGGQTAPLLPSFGQVAGLVNIAVGSGATRHNQPGVRRRAPLLWHVLSPLLCRLCGYFPGARIGILGDIPRGVMEQWRRWCLTPDYLLSGEPGARDAYGNSTAPVLGLTFADDELLLESGSRMLHDAYRQAEVDYRVIDPARYQQKRIGHFGFFKPSQETTLWPLVTGWLEQRLAHC